MKLNNLTISNFKGIKNFDVNFTGKNYNIYADNGIGKTRIYDAWLWLWFNKDSFNQTKFPIMPIVNDQVQHNVEVAVGADVDIKNEDLSASELAQEGIEANVRQYKFVKTLNEVWTRPRGSADKVLTSHKTKYFIDTNEKSEAEYKTSVNVLAREKVFQILSNPLYFNEVLKPEERRNILFSLTKISDKDIARDYLEFKGLISIFERNTAADYKKSLAKKKASIIKEKDGVKARIDELCKITVKEIDTELVKKQIVAFTKDLTNVQNKQKGIVDVSLIKQLSLLNELLEQKKSDKNSRINKLNEALQPPKDTSLLESSIQEYSDKIKTLRTEWENVNKEALTTDNICSACSQVLPAKMIESIKKDFNLKKATKLEQITEQGKKLSKQLDNVKKSLSEAEKSNKDMELLKAKTEKDIATIQTEDIPEIAQISELEAKIQTIKDNSEDHKQQEEEKVISASLEDLRQQLATAKSNSDVKASISKLDKEEVDLTLKFAQVQDDILLIENFNLKKTELLEKQINNRFETVKFKLFSKPLKGEIKEICETSLNGVPYSGLSGGERINAGLDIIRELQKYKKLNFPIFINNRESVTKLIDMGDTQIINLIVEAGQKTLKIEEA